MTSGCSVQTDVVVLNLAQNLGVDAHLAVSGILFVAGMNADPAELAQCQAQAENGEDHNGNRKDNTLEESGHTHHRGGLQGEASRSHLIDAMIPQLVRNVAFCRGQKWAITRFAVTAQPPQVVGGLE